MSSGSGTDYPAMNRELCCAQTWKTSWMNRVKQMNWMSFVEGLGEMSSWRVFRRCTTCFWQSPVSSHWSSVNACPALIPVHWAPWYKHTGCIMQTLGKPKLSSSECHPKMGKKVVYYVSRQQQQLQTVLFGVDLKKKRKTVLCMIHFSYLRPWQLLFRTYYGDKNR